MVKLTDVTGIGPVTAKLLAEHSIKTVEALASISLAELQKVPGFSEIRARAVKTAAASCLRNKGTKPLVVASNVPTTVKKATTKQAIANPVVHQAEANDVVQDKKKNKKDDKKQEKVKDKDKKKKNKKKDSKKKRKDKKKS